MCVCVCVCACVCVYVCVCVHDNQPSKTENTYTIVFSASVMHGKVANFNFYLKFQLPKFFCTSVGMSDTSLRLLDRTKEKRRARRTKNNKDRGCAGACVGKMIGDGLLLWRRCAGVG
ncbi:hypothetical protein Y032_0473g2110 [Ancylostoma ceylanicum]|uniref:Secreted protein n=1 Tax=Ancylostoma ceylanicum TaxID=53326 RepID=A0A016WWQ5_9BILA|nr:hypothetical protein Y032_0473g2110 [Ancylostoma ceylanicum]